jgi:hypothetical protein
MVLATSEWEASLEDCDVDGRAWLPWLQENSVYVPVTEPLWRTDDAATMPGEVSARA